MLVVKAGETLKILVTVSVTGSSKKKTQSLQGVYLLIHILDIYVQIGTACQTARKFEKVERATILGVDVVRGPFHQLNR